MLKKTFFFVTFLVCSFSSSASQLPDYPFIHTTGYAYITVTPDIAEIMFEISATDADPELAFNTAAGRVAEIQTLLAQQGLPDTDVVIRDLKKRLIKSDTAQGSGENSVELSCDVYLKIRDLSKWQAIMAPLLKMQNLGKFSTGFDASERTKIELDLASAAIIDAQRKATALVSVVGKRLAAATAISEGRIKNLGSSVGLVTEGQYSSDRDARHLAQGEDLLAIAPLKLQAAIDVIFEMKPKSGK
ncbi:MAG: SIMPL domain-containing protein [Pseudomonadota bacterium]